MASKDVNKKSEISTMLGKNNEDSSSSEDETYKNALKEAADNEYLKNLYSIKENNNRQTSEKTNTCDSHLQAENAVVNKSLRRNKDENDQFENFGVTPSFQNFVAKKLDEIVERSIQLKKKEDNHFYVPENHEDNNDKTGVKLLSTSVDFLTTTEPDQNLISKKKRKKKQETEEDGTNRVKCKEVAVDPEQILSKADTKSWTSKRKEPEFKYKRLKNGTLEEV